MPLVPIPVPSASSVMEEEEKNLHEKSPLPDYKKTSHFETSNSLPRLMQSDSIVLCGIDFPHIVTDCKLRVIVALKRVWHDAPKDVALILRDLLPSGERRAAVIQRSLGEGAEAVGIEVPMGESGMHMVTLQIAKIENGEKIEIFRFEDHMVDVKNPPPPNLGESQGYCLRGIDVPTSVSNGTLRAIVAIERTSAAAPDEICLLVRDKLPNGESRLAVVKKVFTDALIAVGAEVGMCEAGKHNLELLIATENQGSYDIVFSIPTIQIDVTNPPMPCILQNQAVILCGIDVNGARWPSLVADMESRSTLRAIVALARIWEDAPEHFAMLVRCVDQEGSVRNAVVYKSLTGCTPSTIGIEVPFVSAGSMQITINIAADHSGTGQYVTLFSVPTVVLHNCVVAGGEEAAAIDEQLVLPLKVTFTEKGHLDVIRRLSFSVKGSGSVYQRLSSALTNAFESELGVVKSFRLTYKDEDGDDIAISSDHELEIALQHRPRNSTVMRMMITKS